MLRALTEMLRWFRNVWTDDANESIRTYRRHVRGLFIGWALTAIAMALIDRFPNQGNLSMYAILGAHGLPWQQHWLAAIEVAAPLLMVWHLAGLQRWGKQSTARP